MNRNPKKEAKRLFNEFRFDLPLTPVEKVFDVVRTHVRLTRINGDAINEHYYNSVLNELEELRKEEVL